MATFHCNLESWSGNFIYTLDWHNSKKYTTYRSALYDRLMPFIYYCWLNNMDCRPRKNMPHSCYIQYRKRMAGGRQELSQYCLKIYRLCGLSILINDLVTVTQNTLLIASLQLEFLQHSFPDDFSSSIW